MRLDRVFDSLFSSIFLVSMIFLAALIGCTRVVSFEKPDQPSIELSSEVGAVTITALNTTLIDSLFPAKGNLSISFRETAGREANLTEAIYEIYDGWGFMVERVAVIVSEGGGRPVAETGGKPIHIDRGSRNKKHTLSITIDRDIARTIYRSQPVEDKGKKPVDGSLLIYYLGYDGDGDDFVTKSLITTLGVEFFTDFTPPPQMAPLVLSADTQLRGTVNVDWSGYSEPSDLDFYQLYWNTISFNNVDLQVNPSTVLAANLPPGTKAHSLSLTASGTYYFALVATDLVGNSIRDTGGSIASIDLTF